MPSSFKGSDEAVDDYPDGSTQQFDNDDPSPGFISLSNLDDSIKYPADEVSPIFTPQFIPDAPSVLPVYGSAGEFGSDPVIFSEEGYGDTVESGYAAMDAPILPPPEDLHPEEGYALREWSRENAIRLEEKEKIEKESLTQIIDEAEEYKIEFYKKREVACAANKSLNRDKEQLFLSSLETFHAEADKSYWKSIAELIPNEVAKIEKRGKKEQEMKPSVVVVQGPKPGKPADLSRMRQLLVKLKHNTPTHLNYSHPLPPVTTNDVKPETAVAAASVSDVSISPQPVAIAVAVAVA